MSLMGNTDAHNAKPKFNYVRETLSVPVAQLTVRTGNTSGNNVIQVSYNDGGQNNVANIGIVAGQYVYFWANGLADGKGGTAGNGVPGFFASNTTVSSTSGNTITLSSNLFNTVSAGYIVEFDNSIVYSTNKTVEKTYNQDTVLVTATRKANAISTKLNPAHTGWVHIQRKINNDGTVRYITETLAILANPTATNSASGNISNTIIAYTGV
jgi:hypothetical protein